MTDDVLERALEVERVVLALLAEYAPRFIGEHAPEGMLRAISELLTCRVWEACAWGEPHFRVHADLVGKQLHFVFVPLSETGRQMQKALEAHRAKGKLG